MNNLLVVLCAVWMTGVTGVLDYAPTNVVAPQFQTVAPTKGEHERYVQVVYKATDHKIMGNTVEPLWPSYEVEYQQVNFTTINNQTISKSSVEFSTVFNATIKTTELSTNGTYNVAATYYQTLDFMTQNIIYTPTTSGASTAVTVTETNMLPFV